MPAWWARTRPVPSTGASPGSTPPGSAIRTRRSTPSRVRAWAGGCCSRSYPSRRPSRTGCTWTCTSDPNAARRWWSGWSASVVPCSGKVRRARVAGSPWPPPRATSSASPDRAVSQFRALYAASHSSTAAGSARSTPSATSWAVARTAGLCRSPVPTSRANSPRSASMRSRVAATAGSGRPTRRPAQATQAASTSGSAAASCASSTARSCTQSSRNASTARGLQRNGSPPREPAKSTHSPRTYPTASPCVPDARASPASRASGPARNSAVNSAWSAALSCPSAPAGSPGPAGPAGSRASGSRASRRPASQRLSTNASLSGSSSARSVARRYAATATRTAASSIGADQVISSVSARSRSSTDAAGTTVTMSRSSPSVWSTTNTTACSGSLNVTTYPVWSPYRSPYAYPPVGATVSGSVSSVRRRPAARSASVPTTPSRAAARSGRARRYPLPSSVDSSSSASSEVGSRSRSPAVARISSGRSGDARPAAGEGPDDRRRAGLGMVRGYAPAGGLGPVAGRFSSAPDGAQRLTRLCVPAEHLLYRLDQVSLGQLADRRAQAAFGALTCRRGPGVDHRPGQYRDDQPDAQPGAGQQQRQPRPARRPGHQPADPGQPGEQREPPKQPEQPPAGRVATLDRGAGHGGAQPLGEVVGRRAGGVGQPGRPGRGQAVDQRLDHIPYRGPQCRLLTGTRVGGQHLGHRVPPGEAPHPVQRPPGPLPVRVRDGAGQRGYPGRGGQGFGEQGGAVPVDVLRPDRPVDHVGEVRGHLVHVAGEPVEGGAAGGHGPFQYRAQLPAARRGHGGDREDGYLGQPVGCQQPGEVVDAPDHVVGAEPVGLVEHRDRDVAVLLERPQVPVVQHLVGVLLRIGHPDHQVDEAEQPVDLRPVLGGQRVEVGQVEQHQPAQPQLGVAVQHALPAEPPLRRDLQPVQQRYRTVRPPHAGERVRGRRPPYPDRRQFHPGQRIEQAGLAAAGRARERHDGVLAGQAQPVTGPPRQRRRLAAPVGRQYAVGHDDEAGEPFGPDRQGLRVDHRGRQLVNRHCVSPGASVSPVLTAARSRWAAAAAPSASASRAVKAAASASSTAPMRASRSAWWVSTRVPTAGCPSTPRTRASSRGSSGSSPARIRSTASSATGSSPAASRTPASQSRSSARTWSVRTAPTATRPGARVCAPPVSSPAPAGSADQAVRTRSSASASVSATTRTRVSGAAARASRHVAIGATCSSVSSAGPPRTTSGSTNNWMPDSPTAASSSPRWPRISSSAPTGTRLSSSASRVPRSRAARSAAHGTASAYRTAVVTHSHRSADRCTWSASARFAATTESRSGASSSARPRRSPGAEITRSAPGAASSPVVRTRWGSRYRSASVPVSGGPRNQRVSPGALTTTGARVVGRSTPAGLTGARTRLLTSVDLPAPVDPPTTTSSGASSRASRGSR